MGQCYNTVKTVGSQGHNTESLCQVCLNYCVFLTIRYRLVEECEDLRTVAKAPDGIIKMGNYHLHPYIVSIAALIYNL